MAIPADASQLDITIAAAELHLGSRALSNLTDANGIPIKVIGTEQPIAASERQYDTYLMGGSRILKFVPATGQIAGRCTDGFAAHRHNGASKTYALITAAHCGGSGSTWIIARGTWPSGPYTDGQIYGDISPVRAESRDGAAIETLGSNPFVYVGGPTASTYTGIDAVASPFVGAELCYSGAPSGTVCGNIVQYVNVQYTLSGLPGVTITGNRSKNLNSLPAVGNGDSGGPGLLPTVSPSGQQTVYASTIISAMYNPGDLCQGEPSSTTRKCSDDVLSTNVSNAAGIMNWTVSTLSDY